MSFSAMAKTMQFELSISLSGENGDIDMLIHEAQEEDWIVEGDEYGEYKVIIKGEVDLEHLPFSLVTSGPSVTIVQDQMIKNMYKVDMTYSVGDDDSSISAETLINGQAPTYLMMSGGDHASGSWGINSTLKLF